jgi:hypothetical protein
VAASVNSVATWLRFGLGRKGLGCVGIPDASQICVSNERPKERSRETKIHIVSCVPFGVVLSVALVGGQA